MNELDELRIFLDRKSRRNYDKQNLNIKEISVMLFLTQKIKNNKQKRPVPSAGARYPIDTYIAVNRVEDIEAGVYKYSPDDHKLNLIYKDETIMEKTAEACFSMRFKQQKFIEKAAVMFFWVAVPYRSEWRYDILAPKLILLEAGHICQNLYLAAEHLGVGACAVGAYDQDKVDNILKLDNKKEMVVYLATAGKVKGKIKTG